MSTSGIHPTVHSESRPAPPEQSGTLVVSHPNEHVFDPLPPHKLSGHGEEEVHRISDGEEQALEWHEVIELQAFSERKAWIEEKTKLLEQMPPIKVFVGLEAVRQSTLDVPGLPSRAELEGWIAEHDRIEKETEIFDSGELKKLKKFTKAAAQRNLSPADTDLIELTLTTIYELDKLLHLLRDRSEQLDLLGVRLTWEERRVGAWVELHSVVTDINAFLRSRARWSPSVYEDLDPTSKDDDVSPPTSSAATNRRNSVVSIASNASDVSVLSSNFSRGARFKLSEQLSRDAAQFSSRVSSLRYNWVNAAGKTLDKLIDDSRKPVPEVLLDEQDKLEDKGINEMEDVGKFIMGVVMQWKKADELYVETVKDKAAALALLEEIEVARSCHPNPRQDAAFLSRVNTLTKRLAMRGHPTNSTPFPSHPLFPDQQEFNDSVVKLLSSEYLVAVEHARKAEGLARQYHAGLDAVRKVEGICKTASELFGRFDHHIYRLTNGVDDSNGNGLPPDLTSEACLQPARHSVYLALLPPLLQELQLLEGAADTLLESSKVVFIDADRPGVDARFLVESTVQIDSLQNRRWHASQCREMAASCAETLTDTRRVWLMMETAFGDLVQIRDDAEEAIEHDMWKQQSHQGSGPLTPESPVSPLPSRVISLPEILLRAETIAKSSEQGWSAFWATRADSLGWPLQQHLSECYRGLSRLICNIRNLLSFLEAIRDQAMSMRCIQEEANNLQSLVDDLSVKFEEVTDAVIRGDPSGDDIVKAEHDLPQQMAQLVGQIQSFSDTLPHRVSFISDGRSGPGTRLPPSRKRSPVSLGFNLHTVSREASAGLHFDPSEIDRIVRADANAYSISLTSGLDQLSKLRERFRFSRISRTFDTAITSAMSGLQGVEDMLARLTELANKGRSAVAHPESPSDNIIPLISRELEALSVSFEQLYKLLHELEGLPNPTHTTLLSSKRRLVEDVERRNAVCKSSLQSLIKDIQLEGARVVESVHQINEPAEYTHTDASLPTLMEAEPRGRQLTEPDQIHAGTQTDDQPNTRVVRAEIATQNPQVIPVVIPSQTGEGGQIEVDIIGSMASHEVMSQWPCSGAAQESDSASLQAGRDPTQPDPSRPSIIPATEGHDPGPVPFALTQDTCGVTPVMGSPSHEEIVDLRGGIFALRKRLRSIGINELARPNIRNAHSLPSESQGLYISTQLAAVAQETDKLLASSDPSLDADMRSLHSEIEASQELLEVILGLARFSACVQDCDNALSDFLEHIDSYPSLPSGPLSGSHTSDPSLPPEQQLDARLTSTEVLINRLGEQLVAVSQDPRASAEHNRVLQTWSELRAMGGDRLQGKKSRPGSVLSSAGQSITSRPASVASQQVRNRKRVAGYSNLSMGSPSQLLAPPPISARRSTSGGPSQPPRVTQPPNRVSLTPSNRSVSGPGPMDTPSRLHNPTFSSRQRTTSISSSTAPVTPGKVTHPLPISMPSRARAQTAQTGRTASPAFSEVSSHSRSSLNLSRNSARSTWSRAPRQSFPNLPRSPPRSYTASVRKPYVANPKNKLDIAVGDVVNKLPSNVNINVEVVADTWKDQSGKYWIGDQDPKLCFCRILRSQTVMVRVGGGWSELSKFIKDHFADAFRILPESPPRFGSREEKWINSSTLSQSSFQLPEAPRTPEPKHSYIPSFALSTPSGTSPRSIKTSSPGSPLAALQFIRRADRESPLLRPETPTRGPRSPAANTLTSARVPVWRP